MASGEQYVRLAVNFLLVVSVSRLLSPSEVGTAVIGVGIMLIAMGLKEFATADFLIKRTEILEEDVRTAFTILLLLMAMVTLVVVAAAPWVGSFYGEEKLTTFLRIAAFAGLIECLSGPITGLLRRDMAFGKLAFINISSVTVNALVVIVLAAMGFSFMSFAYGLVAASTTISVLSFALRPDFSFLRPSLSSWRTVASFGGYNGASQVINRLYESMPQLVLGHVLPHSSVGIYNRASVVSDIPDRIFLAGASLIAFPALAAELRRGQSVKEPYLLALGHITVFYWPAVILIAVLAYPIVGLVLGPQWDAVAPLLQVMAIGSLAWFPVILTSPVLLAVGAVRDRMLADLTGRSIAAVILCFAALFGVMAMAVSKLLTLPFQMLVAFYFVRRHVPFTWSELGRALRRSALVTVASAAGPVAVMASTYPGKDLSVAAIALTLLLAGGGWFAGIVLARHPVLGSSPVSQAASDACRSRAA